ncbi:alpha/beta fold hydrolase [Thorsellia kenyensis]|uniref:Alpha/beta fold hydrolase n=1 Tax=Thorsellia kenyensis TaxID=1549888 RepID=A0ABV6C8A0_9GAMM
MNSNQLAPKFHYSNSREENFSIFKTQALEQFWDTITESKALNYRCQNIAYMHKCHPDNDKVIALITGRSESYFRYKELIYDLFHEGYDVFCFDHVGQGLSDRILADEQRGYIDDFHHYVGDLIRTVNDFFATKQYKQKFAIAHSLGGGILAHSILKSPNLFSAAVFCAPMFGINIPLPKGVADNILNLTEKYQVLRESYVLGGGKWRPLPFSINRVTHSQVRYEYNIELLQSRPVITTGGPTYHWVREAKKAAFEIQNKAKEWVLPSLIIQAGKEIIVCNSAQENFVKNSRVKPKFIVHDGAKHELLMEKDEIRVAVLNSIFEFFATYDHENSDTFITPQC